MEGFNRFNASRGQILILFRHFDQHLTPIEQVSFRIFVSAVAEVTFTGRLAGIYVWRTDFEVGTPLVLSLFGSSTLGMCHCSEYLTGKPREVAFRRS